MKNNELLFICTKMYKYKNQRANLYCKDYRPYEIFFLKSPEESKQPWILQQPLNEDQICFSWWLTTVFWAQNDESGPFMESWKPNFIHRAFIHGMTNPPVRGDERLKKKFFKASPGHIEIPLVGFLLHLVEDHLDAHSNSHHEHNHTSDDKARVVALLLQWIEVWVRT